MATFRGGCGCGSAAAAAAGGGCVQAVWELRRNAAQRWGSRATRSRVSGGVSDSSATFGTPHGTDVMHER